MVIQTDNIVIYYVGAQLDAEQKTPKQCEIQLVFALRLCAEPRSLVLCMAITDLKASVFCRVCYRYIGFSGYYEYARSLLHEHFCVVIIASNC